MLKHAQLEADHACLVRVSDPSDGRIWLQQDPFVLCVSLQELFYILSIEANWLIFVHEQNEYSAKAFSELIWQLLVLNHPLIEPIVI